MLDKTIQLRAFVGDRELYPWNHVATGAWVVFKRLPFSEEVYDPPDWHSTSVWDRTHLTDDYIISSFLAYKEYTWLLELDYRRSHAFQRAKIAEALGREAARPRRRILGIATGCLKVAETPEETERAFCDNFGRLVVQRPDEAEFCRHVVPPRPPPRYPMLAAPPSQYPMLAAP